MKNFTFLSVLFVFFALDARAQCSSSVDIVSSNGYTVHVVITPTSIIPSTLDCPWGYNFNVAFDYSITFSGSNIPSSLNTLQGHIPCSNSSDNFFDLPNSGGVGSTNTGGNIWRGETDCTTATVESLGCSSVDLTIEGPGISTQTINVVCNPPVPLPVELVSFEANNLERYVDLTWKTASEFNNDFFEIQKSTDGIKWQVVGSVEGAGSTNQSQFYSFKDFSPNQGSIVYYRLRQVDYDGAEDFSEIRSVRVSASIWTLAPNPANEFTILRSIESISLNDVVIKDIRGLSVQSSDNLNRIDDYSVMIQTSKLTTGVYFVTVNGRTDKLIVN